MTDSLLPARRTAPHAVVARCDAKKKRGTGRCSKPAGWRTDHAGQGRCYLHGGATPVRSGRYSTINRARLRDLIAKHEADPAPLDTLPELASARALFQDFIERYDENTAAIVAWHSSRSVNKEDQESLFALINELEEMRRGKGIELSDHQLELLESSRRAVAQLNPDHERPRSILDLADAYRIVAEITKIVERIEKATNSITYDQLKRFLFGFDRVLSLRITDVALLEQLRTDLMGVAIA